MLKRPDFLILEDLTPEISDDKLELTVKFLINELKLFLGFQPYTKNVSIIISKKKELENLKIEDIFSIGVKREFRDPQLIVTIKKGYNRFISFIILREIYNLFIPDQLKNYELVQLVINQILMNDLSKHKHLIKWRSLIRKNVGLFDSMTGGINRLTKFDRLERFFKIQGIKAVWFFFHYLQKDVDLIIKNIEDIHKIFFREFQIYISKSMNNDEIIETIRCLTFIFYNVKSYRNLNSYIDYFKDFKEKGLLQTTLSQRKFIKNMRWINKYSYIAPSYKLFYNSINVCLISISIRFHPLLSNAKIFKVLNDFPFFISPKISRHSFSLDIFGYIVIPKVYLEDLINFLKILANKGYVIKHKLLLISSENQNLNLNYFRKYSLKHQIINPNHRFYDKKFNIEFEIDYGKESFDTILDLLDFLVLDRIRYFSASGWGFEKRTETIQSFKIDLLNEIIYKRATIKRIKDVLELIHNTKDLEIFILNFLESNEDKGFFYIKTILKEFLSVINFIEELLEKHPEINNFPQFRDLIKNQFPLTSIDKHILLKDYTKNNILTDLISEYFKSKKVYKKNLNKYRNANELIISFYNIKLFNLNVLRKIITDRNLEEKILSIERENLKNSYEKYKLYKITSQEIDIRIKKFLTHKPPIIHPYLINTIITTEYTYDFLQLLLKDSLESRNKIKAFSSLFPRFLIYMTINLHEKEKVLYIEVSTPFLTRGEKNQLFSIFYNYFKGAILYAKSYLWSGFNTLFSSRSFYNFNTKEFFYTKDLYNQFLLYVKGVFGEEIKFLNEVDNNLGEKFWSKEKNILNFVEKVNNRVSRQNLDFNVNHLHQLLEFHLRLSEFLIDDKKFKRSKQNISYKNFVKSINVFPNFQLFGLGQYFLYLYPVDMNELDFKLLLGNTFQKIQYPACIDNSNALFIRYIIPHRKPPNKYLHWLTKSKRIIREHCGFFIKKLYQILHFGVNLDKRGWIYDKDKFKIHIQKILFNPDYIFQTPEIKEYFFSDTSISSYFGPESPEYQSFTHIYSWKSIDIKTFIGTKNLTTISHINNLLKKNLIFPYLSLKNLDLHKKVYIIIPNLKKRLNETLLKIFSFFNLVFIYEIEGEYFIYGFDEEIKFENGLMIKVYFPKCEIGEFERQFDQLFEYLEIKDYIILNDLVDGKNLIKSIFGGLDFLKSYNPLKNLQWNEKEKRWMNPKVFTSKFEPIYPDLIPKDNN